jgi:hypothetical protein
MLTLGFAGSAIYSEGFGRGLSAPQHGAGFLQLPSIAEEPMGQMRSDKVLGFHSVRTRKDHAPVRQAPRSIVLVGRDQELLRLRQQAIRSQSSLEVHSLAPEEADSWSARTQPHLWVFCHTVELPRLVYLACRVLRFSPESRLILIEGRQRIGFESSLFHRILRPSDGPGGFLDAVSDLSAAA